MTERRFWNRVGLHVTKNQALEWVDRVSSGPRAGEYLVDDVEEFSQVVAPGADSLTREIDRLFSQPAEEVEIKLDPLTASIHAAIEMENNKMTRLRELIAEGLSKAEAKETYQIEMGLLVADALDIDLDEYREKQASMIADTRVLDYDSMNVSELKSLLKEQNLPVSGKKANLITRLQESE
jgi:hypothetical protein